MIDKLFSFEGLEVYKAARVLVRDVYRLQHKFPKVETYALGDQIRRSSSSVTSNIAEGKWTKFFQEESTFHRNCIRLFDGGIQPIADSTRLGVSDGRRYRWNKTSICQCCQDAVGIESIL